jgi:hypothetical protein
VLAAILPKKSSGPKALSTPLSNPAVSAPKRPARYFTLASLLAVYMRRISSQVPDFSLIALLVANSMSSASLSRPSLTIVMQLLIVVSTNSVIPSRATSDFACSYRHRIPGYRSS